jgi:hypothetical protein
LLRVCFHQFHYTGRTGRRFVVLDAGGRNEDILLLTGHFSGTTKRAARRLCIALLLALHFMIFHPNGCYEYEDIKGEPHKIKAQNINPYLFLQCFLGISLWMVEIIFLHHKSGSRLLKKSLRLFIISKNGSGPKSLLMALKGGSYCYQTANHLN